jgi:RNA polymerase sigma-70 factor (ECF subfamily)
LQRVSSPRFEAPASGPTATVHALHDAARLDDERLLDALRARHARAPGAFFDRFHAHVERVLTRILGCDPEVADMTNDTFLRALDRVDRLEDARGLKSWLTAIAVNVARENLRSRRRRRWLRVSDDGQLADVPAHAASPEAAEAVRRLYAALATLPAEERIALALRFVDGMELTEVAAACDVSLATIKRTLARAQDRFVAVSRRDPVLREWLEAGTRWGQP